MVTCILYFRSST